MKFPCFENHCKFSWGPLMQISVSWFITNFSDEPALYLDTMSCSGGLWGRLIRFGSKTDTGWKRRKGTGCWQEINEGGIWFWLPVVLGCLLRLYERFKRSHAGMLKHSADDKKAVCQLESRQVGLIRDKSGSLCLCSRQQIVSGKIKKKIWFTSTINGAGNNVRYLYHLLCASNKDNGIYSKMWLTWFCTRLFCCKICYERLTFESGKEIDQIRSILNINLMIIKFNLILSR